MTKVFIVQAIHPRVPGNPMSAHVTREGADREANALTNVMLHDFHYPQIPPDAPSSEREDALEKVRLRLINDGADYEGGDVWITELELEP